MVLADEIKYGPFDVWPQRLDRIEGERKAASIVGVQITDRRMRAMSGERHGEPPGRDGKDDVQKSVERMRCVTLRSGLAKCSRSSWRRLFPLRRNAWRSDAPAKRGRVRPCVPRRLCFGDHRLLHDARAAGRLHEPGGVARLKRPGLCGAGDLRLNDADGDRQRIGERLRAQHRGALARACRHDGHKLAHPIENNNRDPMRSAEPHSLDRDDAAPSRHNDRGGQARAGIVSKPPLAVANHERAAPDGKAGVVGLSRYDARLDRKPGLPKSVAFRVNHRFGYGAVVGLYRAVFVASRERRLLRSQQSLPRSPAIRPRGGFGISAIDSGAGRAARQVGKRRGKVYRIATGPPHTAKLSRAARRVIPLSLPMSRAGSYLLSGCSFIHSVCCFTPSTNVRMAPR